MTNSTNSGIDVIEVFLHDLDRHPLPDSRAQIELAKRVSEGDSEARMALIASNLRLVIFWAKRYQGRGVDFSDLVQEGAFGLMHAVDKFDWRRGFRFATYATWWVRQALQRAIQQQGTTIRVPADRVEQSQRSERLTWELAASLKRGPTPAEVAEASGVEVTRFGALDDVAHVVASLDQLTGAETATSLGDLVAEDDSRFEDEVERALLLDGVIEAVEGLEPLERDVLRFRFGLDGGQPASLQATASRVGVGVRRVRQIEMRALQSLAVLPEIEEAYYVA
jgi:RNA polymerase primary sigma factor